MIALGVFILVLQGENNKFPEIKKRKFAGKGLIPQ